MFVTYKFKTFVTLDMTVRVCPANLFLWKRDIPKLIGQGISRSFSVIRLIHFVVLWFQEFTSWLVIKKNLDIPMHRNEREKIKKYVFQLSSFLYWELTCWWYRILFLMGSTFIQNTTVEMLWVFREIFRPAPIYKKAWLKNKAYQTVQ